MRIAWISLFFGLCGLGGLPRAANADVTVIQTIDAETSLGLGRLAGRETLRIRGDEARYQRHIDLEPGELGVLNDSDDAIWIVFLKTKTVQVIEAATESYQEVSLARWSEKARAHQWVQTATEGGATFPSSLQVQRSGGDISQSGHWPSQEKHFVWDLLVYPDALPMRVRVEIDVDTVLRSDASFQEAERFEQAFREQTKQGFLEFQHLAPLYLAEFLGITSKEIRKAWDESLGNGWATRGEVRCYCLDPRVSNQVRHLVGAEPTKNVPKNPFLTLRWTLESVTTQSVSPRIFIRPPAFRQSQK